MTIKESVECAEQLRESYRDVVVMAADEQPSVRAREQFRGPTFSPHCVHEMQRTARNVTAGLYSGRGGSTYATGESGRGQVFRFVTLRTCCRCDAVTSYELVA